MSKRARGLVSPEEADEAIKWLQVKKRRAMAEIEADLAAGLAELGVPGSTEGSASHSTPESQADLQALQTQLCNRYVEILEARIHALQRLARNAAPAHAANAVDG